jgi:hypothetical protein
MKKLEKGGVTGKVNSHMTHAEDLVIVGGSSGLDWVIKMMTNLYENLKGFTPKEEIILSVKIDGAPAIFAWSEFPGIPSAGIATKGLFAKKPKTMLNEKDIDMYYGDKPQLAYKLLSFFKYLKSIKIPIGEIWQGDFLFDDKSLQETEIDGDPYYAFHPNTIYYLVPKKSDLGKEIKKADVGVVWHTIYTGDDLNSVEASYNASAKKLKPTPKVFMTDPYIKSLAGKINFTEEESESIDSKLSIISRNAEILKSNVNEYNEIINNKDLVSIFSIFWNSLIREESYIKSTDEFLMGLIGFIQNRFLKESDKRKTEVGKKNIIKKGEDIILFIDDHKDILEIMVATILEIVELKEKLLNKLNQVGRFKTYLKMKEGGTRKTGQEGFAVSDINSNVVKLVDRKEFSWSNFSPDVLKGWS